METELPFGNIFCFQHDWKTSTAGRLVYGFHCVICRNTRQSDARRKSPAKSDVVASELVDVHSKRFTVIARSQGIHKIIGSLDFVRGIRIRSIEGGETALPLGLFDDPVHLLERAAPPGTAPEIRFGHPAPVARRHVSRARSSNVDDKRQRSLIQA